MSAAQEFHYRLRGRTGGRRLGSHPGSSLGAGQEFASHLNLYDLPDPRRLDLRASLRNVRGDWLVRVYRQRAGIPVHAVVDVSASMRFGPRRPKLRVVADFVEALGRSAFRVGDALGMLAFDAAERRDLHVPALRGRGMGSVMASMLARCETHPGGIGGLEQAALHLAGREGLVFLLSDFHWPLERLGSVLDLLAHAYVVPMIVWDPAEIEPPARNALAVLHDAESGMRRTLWMRPGLRAQWREAVARRRENLEHVFAAHGLRPFYVLGAFDGEALTRYFLEAAA
jgi:uncharacterized protein (DUF58 family)